MKKIKSLTKEKNEFQRTIKSRRNQYFCLSTLNLAGFTVVTIQNQNFSLFQVFLKLEISLFQSLFESEKSSLSEALSAAQISLQREKTRVGELTQQCRTLKECFSTRLVLLTVRKLGRTSDFWSVGCLKLKKVSFENLKTESDDYKVKAQRILQSKGNDFIFCRKTERFSSQP